MLPVAFIDRTDNLQGYPGLEALLEADPNSILTDAVPLSFEEVMEVEAAGSIQKGVRSWVARKETEKRAAEKQVWDDALRRESRSV